jgi:hypothetical protein
MKLFIYSLALVTCVALVGCTQGKPGGPGTTAEKPTIGQAEDTFNLSVPTFSSSLKQGEELNAVIGIERAKNFDQDVAIKFTNLPKGVTIDPAEPTLKSSDTDVKIVFKAENDSPLGDYKITVTGHPTSGSDAEVEFTLSVAAKDSFTLSPPTIPELKQGESQTVEIGITREKDFDQEVRLEFDGMPTGVSLKSENPVLIKKSETTAQITLVAAEDASLGDFEVSVFGHPTQGADAKTKLNFTVTKK